MDGSAVDLFGQLTELFDWAITLDQFQRWFAEAEWRIEATGSDDDVDLARLVENRLAEYTGGHVDADEVIAALRGDLAAWPTPIAGSRFRASAVGG